jgi:hypothetical protein
MSQKKKPSKLGDTERQLRAMKAKFARVEEEVAPQTAAELRKQFAELDKLMAEIREYERNPFGLPEEEPVNTDFPMCGHLVAAELKLHGVAGAEVRLITPYGIGADGRTAFYWEIGPSRFYGEFVTGDGELEDGQVRILHDYGVPIDKHAIDWDAIDAHVKELTDGR